MENSKKTYKLTGLLLIFIGYLGSMVFSIPANMFSPENPITLFFGVLVLGFGIAALVGIFILWSVNFRFRRAGILTLIMIGAGFVGGMVLGGIAVSMLMTETGGLYGFLVPLVIFIVPMVVLSFIFYFNLVYGCREVALGQNDEKFARTCLFTWRVFLWGNIGSGILLLLGFLAGGMELLNALTDEYYGGPTVAVAIAILLVLLASLLSLAVTILLNITFYRTYKRFHGAEIIEAAEGTGSPEAM